MVPEQQDRRVDRAERIDVKSGERGVLAVEYSHPLDRPFCPFFVPARSTHTPSGSMLDRPGRPTQQSIRQTDRQQHRSRTSSTLALCSDLYSPWFFAFSACLSPCSHLPAAPHSNYSTMRPPIEPSA